MGGHSTRNQVFFFAFAFAIAIAIATSILILATSGLNKQNKNNAIEFKMSTSLEQIQSEIVTAKQTIEARPPPDLWSYSSIPDRDCWHPPNPSAYIRPDLVSPWIDSDFAVSVFSDWQLHGREDYWQNPDYTLYYGKGDCEDWAIAYCSLYRAKGIDAIVVIGYKAGLLHAWCEFYDSKTYWIRDIYTVFPRDSSNYRELIMFNEKITWQSYKNSWNAS
ncbi:MAG: transglutaminase-like domain-containing protein [Methanocellales archaeon]